MLHSQVFGDAEVASACCLEDQYHALVAGQTAEMAKATAHYLRTQARRTRCRHTDSRQHPAEDAAVVASVAGTVAAVAVALGIVHQEAHRLDGPVLLVGVHAVNLDLLLAGVPFHPATDTLVFGEVAVGLGSPVCHSHLDHNTDSSSVKIARGPCNNS